MYIPPEEKKPLSKLARWTLRLLVLAIFIFLSFLFVVSTISGTGDVQKSGLQQAMSSLTGSKVTISKLTQFNIFPQFVVGLEGVEGDGVSVGAGFSIGELTYAKSFWDWYFNNETSIQNLSITALKTNPGVFGSQVFEITKASIVPPKDKAQPYLIAEGLYGIQKFSARFDLIQTQAGVLPNYEIGKGGALDLRFGDFHLEGKFYLTQKESRLQDATLRVNDGDPVTGDVKITPVDNAMTVITNFTAGETKGQLIWTPKKNLQEWKFDRLHLNQVVATNPVWHAIRTSWEEIVPPVSRKLDTAAEPPRTSVVIDTLDGVLSGTALQAEFLLKPEGLLGRWSGNLKDQGSIDCGLLNQHVVALKMGTEINGGRIDLDDRNGKITYTTTKAAEKITIPAEDRKRLKLDQDHACDELMNLTAP